MSTPIEVFALLVTCEVGITLSRRGVDLNAWDADMNDDLPRGVYDEMDGWLQDGLNRGEVDHRSS